MNPDLLKLLALTVGAIVSAPFVLASVRAFFFFGQMSQAVKTVDREVQAMKAILQSFTTEVRDVMSDHETRLTTIEAERRAETRGQR